MRLLQTYDVPYVPVDIYILCLTLYLPSTYENSSNSLARVASGWYEEYLAIAVNLEADMRLTR
jgi:hypothetical protein